MKNHFDFLTPSKGKYPAGHRLLQITHSNIYGAGSPAKPSTPPAHPIYFILNSIQLHIQHGHSTGALLELLEFLFWFSLCLIVIWSALASQLQKTVIAISHVGWGYKSPNQSWFDTFMHSCLDMARLLNVDMRPKQTTATEIAWPNNNPQRPQMCSANHIDHITLTLKSSSLLKSSPMRRSSCPIAAACMLPSVFCGRVLEALTVLPEIEQRKRIKIAQKV